MNIHTPFRLCLLIAVLFALSACAGDTAPASTSKPANTTAQPATIQPDANGDGFISPAEVVAFREAQRQEQMLKMAERQLAHMDTDHDGKVSVAEFAGATARPTNASPEAAAAQRDQRAAMITERIEARRAQMQTDAEAAKPSPTPEK